MYSANYRKMNRDYKVNQPTQQKPAYRGHSNQCPNCHGMHLATANKFEPYCSDTCKVTDFAKPKVWQKVFPCHHAGCTETDNLTSIKAFGEWERYCNKHLEQYRMFPNENTAPAFLLDLDNE